MNLVGREGAPLLRMAERAGSQVNLIVIPARPSAAERVYKDCQTRDLGNCSSSVEREVGEVSIPDLYERVLVALLVVLWMSLGMVA